MSRKPNRPKEVIIAEREAKKLAAAERKQNRMVDLFVCRDALKSTILGMLAQHQRQTLTDRHKTKYARILVNRIAHEIPAVYSGKISVAALIRGYLINVTERQGWKPTPDNPIYKEWSPTPEHFNPSQAMGSKWVNTFLALGRFDDGVLDALLKEALQIHKVTKEENIALVKYQKTGVFVDAVLAYIQCGIVLVDWPVGTKWKQAAVMYPEYFR